MSLDNKINFKPLTIDWIRKNAWDPKTKTWMSFKYYYQNGGYPNNEAYGPQSVEKVTDRNKHEKVFCSEFQPDGNLIERNWKTDEQKIYKKWLSGTKPGPYKYENYNYANKNYYFYYLSGKGKFSNGEIHDYPLQICQTNSIGDNCIDGPNWIEVEPNDLLE